MNPIQWLLANYARNLADYRGGLEAQKEAYQNQVLVKLPGSIITASEAARILGRTRDPGYEKRRRETTDAMREKAGLPKWRWQ